MFFSPLSAVRFFFFPPELFCSSHLYIPNALNRSALFHGSICTTYNGSDAATDQDA